MKVPTFVRKKQHLTMKDAQHLHALGVYLSMYWLKSRRNWVLLSDSFSSLQYSLKKQICFNLHQSGLPLQRANTRDGSPWGDEGVTILVKPLQLQSFHCFKREKNKWRIWLIFDTDKGQLRWWANLSLHLLMFMLQNVPGLIWDTQTHTKTHPCISIFAVTFRDI